ncbi:MAG: hypothetical protein ACOCQR_00780 [bacterium]
MMKNGIMSGEYAIPTYNQTGLVQELLHKKIFTKDDMVNYNDYEETIWHWNTVPYPFANFLREKGEIVLTPFTEDIWWGRKDDCLFEEEPLVQEYIKKVTQNEK